MSDFVVIVQFTVHDGMIEAFSKLVTENARDSLRLEEGCHRFDVVRTVDNESMFLLYEVYSDESAFKLHLETQHFVSFDLATSDMVKVKEVTIGSLVQ
ncbi:quinol monooxygenase YgiN [Rhodoligotrophos appendicifer]|uniref:putative quinol monooxygenase n=1 Tax=Rhodoligotrophos appendicifer TaxID=987056 RepID=UPI00147921D4|nr:putative quinol monooxygenase [Rhodoligotrophos appendicifer]